MKKPLKICTIGFTSLLAFYGLSRAIDSKMHGFSYQNFKIDPPPSYSIQFQNHPDANKILSQTFHYLSYGGESLVFASEDNQWVLKVFKRHRLYHFRQFQSLKVIPFLKKFLEKRVRIYDRFWESLKLQSEELASQTGLVYVNLPHSPSCYVHLIDPIGTKHKLDLGQVCFVIQKKGALFKHVYAQTKSIDERKALLAKLVLFYKYLENHGLKIWDNAISRNMGIIDGEPFLIDTGSVCPKPNIETFEQNVKHLKSWIINHDPELLGYVLDLIAAQKTINTF